MTIRLPLRPTPIPLVVSLAIATACAPPDRAPSERVVDDLLRLAAAEDARPEDGPELNRLVEALDDDRALVRRTAVRALGRLERPELVDPIRSLLADPAPLVRAEATNALAQAVHRGGGDTVLPDLLARVPVENDPIARAALARSLGRSASSPDTRREVEQALVALSRVDTLDAPVETLVGVTVGFEALVRRSGGEGLGGTAANRLAELALYQVTMRRGGDAARVRSLAYAALGGARRLDRGLLTRALRDPSAEVRVVGATFVGGLPPSQRPEYFRRFLGDAEMRVALEALRRVAQEPRDELYCRFLLAGTDPQAPPAIRVIAFDGLAAPCPQAAEQRDALATAAASIESAAPSAWHAPAHALVALARTSPSRARSLITPFAEHANPFARAYAARAAAEVGETAVLEALADDPDPNVRTAALTGLFSEAGHAIDDRLLAALAGDDPQLLMTVAGLLESTPLGNDAAVRLLDAFERISEARRETWRDSRRALLERIRELGDETLVSRLTPYLSDYDPVVASDVEAILELWGDATATASPAPPARLPIPTPSAYRALEDAHVVLHMREGGRIVIALDPWGATTNVHRFVRLVDEGYFDGLTFHRWAPNFVIQGGSPHANEYQGDGPFSRDEVGLPGHWRGTVGISTRGRDTGDAQLFVNLVHNVRLNHDYTIVGQVVEGMDAVDRVLEGSVIERAEVVRGN